ncbi:putative porin [Pseudobdellovibrio sp. HCB154]|uniref:putative porin n=1 Tax=Pseudobdellovibrio sp. HCB154 TaxID=3386277 RepID=UPI00391741BE
MRLTLSLAAFFLSIHGYGQDLSVSNTAMVSAPLAITEFTPSNKFSGDFRYRHQETKDNSKQTRRVHRLMLRVGQTFQIQSDLKFTYRLMTGNNNNSGNTTIADGGTSTQGSPRYAIGLDQAYVTYLPEKNLSLFLGKMPQFFYTAGKNQVILDRDIAPEGLGVQYRELFLEKALELNLNLASLWVREKYNSTAGEDLTDSFLNVAQATLNYKINSDFSTQLGLGTFAYTDIKGSKPNDLTVQTAPDFKGNTADGSGNYLNGYEILQTSAEIKWVKSPFDVSLFFEHLKNNEADSLNEAQIFGLVFSYEKFSLSVMRQTIESDAVLAIYTSADQAGGVANSRGNVILLGYKLNKNAVINYSLYDFEKNVETSPTDFKVSHLDLTISF